MDLSQRKTFPSRPGFTIQNPLKCRPSLRRKTNNLPPKPYLTKRVDQYSKTRGNSKAKLLKNKRKLKTKNSLTSNDGLNPPDIEMIWQDVDQYMRTLTDVDMQFLRNIITDSKDVVAANTKLLLQNKKDEYFLNLIEDIGCMDEDFKQGHEKSDLLSIPRRGRFYEEVWNEKQFVDNLQSDNPGIYEHLQVFDNWSDAFPGYDDDLVNVTIDRAEEQLDFAYREAVKKSKLRMNSSTSILSPRQISCQNLERFTIPSVPVDQWHPGHWGNFERICYNETKIDTSVIHPAAFNGSIPPRWIAMGSPETSKLYGNVIEQDEICDEIQRISTKYVPLSAVNSRRLKRLYDVVESEYAVQSIFAKEKELDSLCEEFYQAIHHESEENSLRIRLNAPRADIINYSSVNAAPQASTITVQATAFAMDLSIGDGVDVFDNSGHWSRGVVKDIYLKDIDHHRFIKVHISGWGDECDQWINVCSGRIFPMDSMTLCSK